MVALETSKHSFWNQVGMPKQFKFIVSVYRLLKIYLSIYEIWWRRQRSYLKTQATPVDDNFEWSRQRV